MGHLQKGSKKLIRAWASYDWANSVYFLVITSTIFPLYYGSLFGDNLYIDFFGQSLKNTALISYTTAAAFAVVAILSPILSGMADYIGNKKSFMQFVSNKIVNSIRGINRVVYDVTSKPPSTIELE